MVDCLVNLESFQVKDPVEHLKKGDKNNVCNYCREAGHWKADCSVRRAEMQHAGGSHVKPVALAASILDSVNVDMAQDGNAHPYMAHVFDESYLR